MSEHKFDVYDENGRKITDNFLEKCKNFYKTHKKEVVTGGVILAYETLKFLSKCIDYSRTKETRHRNKTYYDYKEHLSWDLRREPNNREKEEIVFRKNAGESVYDILNDMGLLR